MWKSLWELKDGCKASIRTIPKKKKCNIKVGEYYVLYIEEPCMYSIVRSAISKGNKTIVDKGRDLEIQKNIK